MDRVHLWQGKWIDDAELAERLPTLGHDIEAALARGMDHRALTEALDQLGRDIVAGADTASQLVASAAEVGGVSARDIGEGMAAIAAFLQRDAIADKVARELGKEDPFVPSRFSFTNDVLEAWAPLGFLVHVTPTNVFTVGALSLVEGLLCGNVNFVKTSASDSLFPQHFARALVERDPSGAIAAHCFVARIASARREQLASVFAHADGVAAWGGEEAIKGVRAMAPASARVIEWGHKISFAYVANGRLDDPEVLGSLAGEVCALEQQACASPQVVYVETDDRRVLEAFAQRLAEVLARLSPTIPRVEPGMLERAEITTVTELARCEAAFGKGGVIEPPDRAWRVLVEHNPGLRASPLFRTIWVKPLPRSGILATLRPLRAYLQTVGLACDLCDLAGLSQLFLTAGATRIRPVGTMLGGSYMGEPHDGVYALQRYARRVSVQLDDVARRVSSLTELSEANPEPPKTSPIMGKDDYHHIRVEPRFAHLFFSSGGSSGEPKLSVFTYDDYHAQMRAAAEGLFAAGLDPRTDRCMNLFVAGRLYGGFLSFFTILEALEAPQLPVGQHTNFAEITDMIVRRGANVLLGEPSYLMQVFEHGGDTLARYRGIAKVFYAGEHMTESQRALLRDRFAVKEIKSAAYGSNDTGPMGYQCPHCEGSVFHLHTRLQALEILDLEADRPVEDGATGRLILTSLHRRGQSISRYEIGDLGRWVRGDCPCGRAAPRFELLGRHGDIFKAGSAAFMNYNRFVRILGDRFGYAGPVQLEFGFKSAGKDALVLRYDAATGLDSDELRKAILADYREVREFTVDNPVLDFQVQAASRDAFALAGKSEKVRHLVDRQEK